MIIVPTGKISDEEYGKGVNLLCAIMRNENSIVHPGILEHKLKKIVNDLKYEIDLKLKVCAKDNLLLVISFLLPLEDLLTICSAILTFK